MEQLGRIAAELYTAGAIPSDVGYGLLREGRHSSTWYIGTDFEGVMVKLFRPGKERRARLFQLALAHASDAGLAPCPLVLSGPDTSNVVVYRYVPGVRLDQEGGRLPVIYSVIGRLTARLHHCLALFRPPSFLMPERSATGDDQLLHGDINATNIIRCGESAFFIDFEDACVGPVERDLAFSLSNVNTSPAEFGECLVALCRAYTSSGGRCDERLLVKEILGAPKRILESLAESSPESVAIARPAAVQQHSFFTEALVTLGLLRSDAPHKRDRSEHLTA